ncbi:hypothetical protein QF038_001889 [Pseudarthrobacter sp. W1I19]|uniref:hypothetical protein n=1 Tax=Pseudarthrobacter sp. W1I19 TaxID=3042288 RepID=UPI002783EB97|nr:hypothetical protein [Pseudarthrobacter sp. W1I19]MDQ0923381.1 hypothetical protein [Pseudarthrobacter sp. W1I19]
MPQHTIGLLQVRIVHNQTDQEVHPSNFGPESNDLLTEWDVYVDGIRSSGGVRHRERFLTVESKKLRATKREVECELDYGHFGNSRRVRDSNTGSQTGSIAGNEVASDALRLLHRVPLNGSFSYIAHEQIGRLSSSGVLTSDFKKWFGSRHDGYRLEIDYVEDADAWNEFLDGANLRELTFVARKPAEGNRAGRPTKELYDIRPDRRGDVLPRRWLDQLRSDGRLPANQVLSVAVDEGDIEETRVVVEKDKRRRTIHIGDDWPRFAWEIEANSNVRPGDESFRSVARDIIGAQLTRLRIDG